MRPKEPRDSGQHDLPRARLDQIIDTGHAPAKLARTIDWEFLSQRLEGCGGEERLVALLQESLAAARRTGAAKPADFSRVIVDTTVQPKAIAFPTDAKLLAVPACTWSARPSGTALPCANPLSVSAKPR